MSGSQGTMVRKAFEVQKRSDAGNAKRFQAFKVSLCGNQLRRDARPGLTLEEARAFPLGRHQDAAGPYIWTYSLMDDYPRPREQHQPGRLA